MFDNIPKKQWVFLSRKKDFQIMIFEKAKKQVSEK
jgi:hypothetical protein